MGRPPTGRTTRWRPTSRSSSRSTRTGNTASGSPALQAAVATHMVAAPAQMSGATPSSRTCGAKRRTAPAGPLTRTRSTVWSGSQTALCSRGSSAGGIATAGASSPGPPAAAMRASLKATTCTVTALTSGAMAARTLGSGRTTIWAPKVSCNGRMAGSTRASSETVRSTGRASSSGLTGAPTRANGRQASSMDMAPLSLARGSRGSRNGSMASWCDG
mmetsp:Transcript_117943/g.328615  ORF Transcript_117943/g.328615 Transcript_117943/m.328615 type:complete len:217 (-) Transcript_117943:304-954(-)